jgi:hypothetical protein
LTKYTHKCIIQTEKMDRRIYPVSTFLLLLASAIFLVAFVDYNKGVLAGKNIPAFAAWAVFSIITLVNGVTYLDWTAQWINTAVIFTDCIVCIGTTVAILIRLKGRVSVDRTDKQIVCISLIAIVLWVVFHAAAAGNLLNQIAYTLAFVPNYRNVWRNPSDEPTRPWGIWTMAFVLNLGALMFQPKTQTMDYVTPSVCLFHHLVMTVLSKRKITVLIP